MAEEHQSAAQHLIPLRQYLTLQNQFYAGVVGTHLRTLLEKAGLTTEQAFAQVQDAFKEAQVQWKASEAPLTRDALERLSVPMPQPEAGPSQSAG